MASVSPAWYSRLEQGTKVRPSPEILDSLADALRLDGSERRYLHALCAVASASAVRPTSPDERTVELVRDVVEEPADLPVFAIDSCTNLVAWNKPTLEWYGDLSGRGGRERNLLWWLFTTAEARARIVDWESYTREQVASLRFAFGANRTDRLVEPFVEELHRASCQFARWWEQHDVLDQEVATHTFRHPHHGVRQLNLLTVRLVLSTSLSIIFHRPGPVSAPQPRSGR